MGEWTGEVDPNSVEDSKRGSDTRYCKAGKKVLAPLGFERWNSSKQTKMLSIMFGCIIDLEKAGDERAIVWRNFALTQNAVRYFTMFAKAMKFTAPFNVFDDKAIESILAKGAFIGNVGVETGEKRDGTGTWTKSEVKFFDPFDGEWEPIFDDLVEELAKLNWDSYMEYRAKHPRGSSSGNTGGGGGGGSSYGGGGGAPDDDSDIPF